MFSLIIAVNCVLTGLLEVLDESCWHSLVVCFGFGAVGFAVGGGMPVFSCDFSGVAGIWYVYSEAGIEGAR